jgi:hypothetical protein
LLAQFYAVDVRFKVPEANQGTCLVSALCHVRPKVAGQFSTVASSAVLTRVCTGQK